jgi:hypothetical protein
MVSAAQNPSLAKTLMIASLDPFGAVRPPS